MRAPEPAGGECAGENARRENSWRVVTSEFHASDSAGGGCGASRRATRCMDAALATASQSPLSASVTAQQSSVPLREGSRPSQRPSISHPSVIRSPQQQTTVGPPPMISQAYMAWACPPSPRRTRTATNRLAVGEVRRKRMRRMIASLVRFRKYAIPHTAAVRIPGRSAAVLTGSYRPQAPPPSECKS